MGYPNIVHSYYSQFSISFFISGQLMEAEEELFKRISIIFGARTLIFMIVRCLKLFQSDKSLHGEKAEGANRENWMQDL